MLVASAKKLISAINEQRRTSLVLDRVQPSGRTARARTTLYVHDEAGRYLVEIATDPVQQYYLNKNIEWPSKHLTQQKCIKYLMPVWHGWVEDALCAIYGQATVLGLYERPPPASFLHGFVSQRTTFAMGAEAIDRIVAGFLQGWPPSVHEHIRRLDPFQEWSELVSRQNAVTLVNEHGDFSANNILVTPDGPLLIDFEFAKTNQMNGFDLFYNETMRKAPNSEIDAAKLKLHRTKLALCHAINDDLDFNRTGVIFHAAGPNKPDSQNADSFPWVEILDYPAAASIKLRACGRGIMLDNAGPAGPSRRALENLPKTIAAKLVSRWHLDGVPVYAMEMIVDCPLGQALMRRRLPSLLRNARSVKETIKILRRMLRGKLYFTWYRRSGHSSTRVFYHGSLKDYLTYWMGRCEP